jgi:uncharacterized protein (DUF362 family)
MNRREFCRKLALAGGAALLGPTITGCARQIATPIPATAVPPPTDAPPTDLPPTPVEQTLPSPSPNPTATLEVAQVAFVRTRDRADGVRRALALLGFDQPGANPMRGNDVLIKANFNSADPVPASTHLDVLRTLATESQNLGARAMTLGERSGMGDTGRVLQSMGIMDLARDFGIDVIQYDDYSDAQFATVNDSDFHWAQGFAVPRILLESGCVVQTCCLKTHRFGGHFTMSLKNSVGLAQSVSGAGYRYMDELHNSPHQRSMIAEINTAYDPALIVMDGVDVFVNGGPDVGTLAEGNIVLAGTDRIAIDAIGVALLRMLGTTPEVSAGRVFEQEQIARAVELGLGIESPQQIAFVTDDTDSAAYADQIRAYLS